MGGDDLTPADVARLMRVTAPTVTGWCRAGIIPGAYQLPGRRWRIRATEFDAWHKRRTGQYVSPDRIEPPSRASRSRIGRSR